MRRRFQTPQPPVKPVALALALALTLTLEGRGRIIWVGGVLVGGMGAC